MFWTHVIPEQAKPDLGRRGLVEKESPYGLLNVCGQFFPGVGLSEDALGQTFGEVATVRFRRDPEDAFFHLRLS
jgi:hypothetical protein